MSGTAGALELLMRGGAAAVLLTLAVALLRDLRAPSRVTGALFCLGAASHALTQSRPAMAALGEAIAPIWVLSVVAAGLFWAFATDLFQDRRRSLWVRFSPATLLLAVGLAAVEASGPWARILWLAQNLIGAGLMAHVLTLVWSGWRGDLVEPRRRLRGPVIAIAAVYALAVTAVQSAELFSRPATNLSMLAAPLLLAMSVAGAVVFQRTDERLFAPSSSAPEPRTTAVPPQDGPALERLRRALEEDEVWRQETLTIGGLAGIVGVPEHRLRKIINEGLGYRNFAAFLNERRIAAARLALADPQNARTPVSAVAYALGFNSLGPFNRVFRETTGQTPTAWRQAALAAQNPNKAL